MKGLSEGRLEQENLYKGPYPTVDDGFMDGFPDLTSVVKCMKVFAAGGAVVVGAVALWFVLSGGDGGSKPDLSRFGSHASTLVLPDSVEAQRAILETLNLFGGSTSPIDSSNTAPYSPHHVIDPLLSEEDPE